MIRQSLSKNFFKKIQQKFNFCLWDFKSEMIFFLQVKCHEDSGKCGPKVGKFFQHLRPAI